MKKAYAKTRRPGAGIKEFLAYEESKDEYYTSPTGIRKLQQAVATAPTAKERAAAELQASVYGEKRLLAINAYHEEVLGKAPVHPYEWDAIHVQAENGFYHQTPGTAEPEVPKLYTEDAAGVRRTADKWNNEISSYLGKDGTFGITNGDHQATYGASREVKLPDYEVERIKSIADAREGGNLDNMEIEVETDNPETWVVVEANGDSMSFSIREDSDAYTGNSGQGIDIPRDAVRQMFSR